MVDAGKFSGRTMSLLHSPQSKHLPPSNFTLSTRPCELSLRLFWHPRTQLVMDAHGDKAQVLQTDQNSGAGCWEADCGSGKWLVGPLVAQDATAFVILITEQALNTIFAFFHKSKNPLQFSFSYWKQVSIEVFLKVKWCNVNFWKARDTCCIKSILGGREINVESRTESSLLPKTHWTHDMLTRQVQDSKVA